MNAISPIRAEESEERRARHLSVCQELIALGLGLARAAAAHGTAAWAQTPTTANATTSNPAAAEASLAFDRVSRSIQRSVTLEAHIAAGTLSPAPRPPSPRSPENPWSEPCGIDAEKRHIMSQILHRRALLQGLEKTAEHHTNAANLTLQFDETITQSLEDHPDDTLTEHFHRVCTTLGLPPNPAHLPPDLVAILTPAATPPPPDRWPR